MLTNVVSRGVNNTSCQLIHIHIFLDILDN